FLGLRMYLDASEVLDATEGEVELQGLLGYVVTERKEVRLQRLVQAPQFVGCLVVVLGDALVGRLGARCRVTVLAEVVGTCNRVHQFEYQKAVAVVPIPK